MSAEALVHQVQRVPLIAWVGAGFLGLAWLCRPQPATPGMGATVRGSEDIQADPGGGLMSGMPAHAVGLPYELGHLCPVSWTGRTKRYPTNSSGVISRMSVPDPADDDGYPWLSYGSGPGGGGI